MKDSLFSLREREIFQALKALQDEDFVIIGGYAVNAYTLPRFSVDCDIVLKEKKTLAAVEKTLVKMGYRKESLSSEARDAEHFSRYEKQLDVNFRVSMDVLCKGVTDRMTGTVFSAKWIFSNSEIRHLGGKTVAEELKLRIIRIDALIVMKTISCRSTDVRDVFMLLPAAENKAWIRDEISARCGLQERIAKIIEKVAARQFKDGLAGVYGYIDAKAFEKHKKAILSLQE